MKKMIQACWLMVLGLVLGCSNGAVSNAPAPVIEDHSAVLDDGQNGQDSTQVNQPELQEENASAPMELTASGGPVEVTDGDFEQIVLRSSMPVLVDFGAPWCPACKKLAPIIDDLAAEYQGHVLFAKLNTDENPKTPPEYEVERLPTMVFFKNGRPVDRLVGLTSKEQIAAVLDSLLES